MGSSKTDECFACVFFFLKKKKLIKIVAKYYQLETL